MPSRSRSSRSAASAAANAPARAAGSAGSTIDIVKISGLIDPLNADLLTRTIRQAQSGAIAVVVQLNSTGGALTQGRLGQLASSVSRSKVPVAVWVGGSGSPRATGEAAAILAASAFRGVAPGALVDATAPIARGVAGGDAVSRHIVDIAAPTLGDFVVALDGRSYAGGAPLHVASVVRVGGQPRRELAPDVQIAFSQLSIGPRILHSAASPNAAFVMLTLALCLGIFEFYTAGIGIAAAAAAMFGVLAAYGLGVLPTRPGGVALVVIGAFGFAVDLQAGAPRVWTAIGGAAFVAGGVVLFAGQGVSWWVLGLVFVLVALFVVSGMPAMIRTRFSTPTIGRAGMVGSGGTALSVIDPDGTVDIDGAPWRARTNRATPIGPGDGIRVVAIDGLVLEVEPEAGGARDYRH